MSSELITFAKVAQLDNLKSYLVGDEDEDYWLQLCLVSYSPCGDILVLAHSNRMVILSSKWSAQETGDIKTTFSVTWQGIPENCGDNDSITSVICLPIAPAQTRLTAHYNPEWTCIVVGFSTGHVRFYTELGSMLVSQMFHNEIVVNIKCRSSQLSSYGGGQIDCNEEMYIVYSTVVCSIIGFALFNTLRACRNQLARVKAKCSETISVPPLTYRKWGFCDQGKVDDCVVAGSVPTNTFMHLVTASLRGGYNAEYRSSPPQRTLVVASGSNPFIGFHYAIESSPVPVLTDVAKAVASKLKSAIGQAVPRGWLFGHRGPPISAAETDAEQTNSEPTEVMCYRFGLYDPDRNVTNIVVSPLVNLAAISDNLGRISIIDLMSGFFIRMLKGYRDAQCGWLLVDENTNAKKVKRRTMFLIIYLSRKGVLEIWPVHNGPRVATFSVQKNARLMYVNYNIVGRMNTTSSKLHSDMPYNVCVLIEPSGELKQVIIPFHCVLGTKDSNKARDEHLLKYMIKILQDDCSSDDKLIAEISGLATNLRTMETKKCAITTLSTNKYIMPDSFLAFLQSLRKNLNHNHEEKELLNHVDILENLTAFYQFSKETNETSLNYSDEHNSTEDDADNNSECRIKNVCSVLHITEEDVDKLLLILIPTIRTIDNKDKQRVTFADDFENSIISLANFLTAFDLPADGKQFLLASLKPDISNEILLSISDLVCGSVMHNKCELDVWKIKCKLSCINPVDLMKMIFCYWLNKQLGITLQTELLNLYHIILAVCENLGKKSVKWFKIRSQLAKSKSPLSAITAAIVCRAVSSHIHEMKSKLEFKESECEDEDEANPASEWETVTQDECDWNILISQLEDITFLDTTLKYQPNESPSTLYCAPYEIPDITLSYILNSGKGSISELVAKWITSFGLNPEYILYFDKTLTKTGRVKKSMGVQEGIPLSTDNAFEAKPVNLAEKEILELLEKLRTFFPYSLSSDCLLANISWEYVLVWKTFVEELRPLNSAIATLKLISSPHIKQGCCCLIWSAHLSQVCENVCRLINKVGKIPKDRLCKQNTGMMQDKIIEFIELWSEFITIFLEAVAELELATEPILKYEVLWDNNMECNSSNTRLPLCQLAVKQKPPNSYLLQLQSQCSRALLILTTFSLRMQKPISNLFDSTSDAVLFFHIQSPKTFQKNIPDDALIECRLTFLKKALSGVIGDILKPSIEPNVQISEYADVIKPVVDWFSRILTLGLDWSVPIDILRRHQIRKLYAYGYDQFAEEVISSATDKESLGYELLTILGQRLKKLLTVNADYFSYFSPTVTSWANSLEDSAHRVNSNIKDLLQLTLTINHLIPEDGKNRYIINQMLDSVEMLNGCCKSNNK